ncbi:MAG: ImmA/IrrE family metallo-endopeptidase, partial [Phaeodactylibacter sp.]|nr:ImmA/IrrE family metallo-endopeptidase [Phaeodactylibacter sp.]
MRKKDLQRILEKEARDFRNQCGLSHTEPLPVRSLLLQLEILTVFRALSPAISGMAVKVSAGQVRRFMLVNSLQTLGRQHFTIAHELYHLFVQEQFDSMICKTGEFDRRDREEYKADLFAAYLLLPTEGILQRIPNAEIGWNKIQLPTILKIEHYFQSSRSALLYRLKEMELIDAEHYDRYSQEVFRSAVQYGYPRALYEPSQEELTIGDYGVRARQLYEADKISEGHYLSLMQAIGVQVL